MLSISNKATVTKLEMSTPKLFKILKDRDSEFVEVIVNISRIVEPILEHRITNVFATYTLHDVNHSLRIMDYMFDLIPENEKLSDLDITILILSALLHDIGMAVRDEEIEKIIEGTYQVEGLSFNAVLRKHSNNKDEALREYIRKIHGIRSSDFIVEKLISHFKIPSQLGTNIADDIAKVCRAHTEDVSWLHKNLKPYNEKASYSYSPLFCGMLLRLADILDFDSQRTPPFLMELIDMNDFSKDEWKQHMDIHNLDKVKTDKQSGEKIITIFGECRDSTIHRKLLNYLEWIDKEILNTKNISKVLHENYKVKLQYPLTNNIETKGYSISDLRLSIDFKAITNLLMGEKIYGSKKYGLRELVQNSIDACKVRQEIEKNRDKYEENEYSPSINIILDYKKNEFIVKDNGIGMSLEVLEKYFLNVGVSYYKSDDFLLQDYKYKPIGNFGIGFLACFMLSEQVNLKTKHLDESDAYKLTLIKNSPYISLNSEEIPSFIGTEIVLNLKEVMTLFDHNKNVLYSFLIKHFLTDSIDFKLIAKGDKHEEIKNELIEFPKKTDQEHIINVSDYMKEIKGYIKIEANKQIHGEGIADIPHNGMAFYYNGEDLQPMDDQYMIKKLYNETEYCVSYLEIPIIKEENRDDFERVYNVLEDLDETIDKLEGELDWISIFYDNQTTSKVERDKEITYEDDYIFDRLSFNNLLEFGHCEDFPTMIFPHDYKVFFTDQEDIFLPFEQAPPQGYPYYFYRNIGEFYIKNILVDQTKFEPTNIWSFIKVAKYKINIENPEILPDVSRNRLDEESLKKLNYGINKCICLWVLDNLSITKNQRQIMLDYISHFYEEGNKLLINQ